MNVEENIKTAFERSSKALALKPSLGLGTGISITRVVDGLTCESNEGNWKFISDMPESAGGHATGPTPGVYGRAALGSCLAIGYMMRAAEMNIHIFSLEVEVQADYDDGALFGTSDSYPGYHEVRYTVSIRSDAPQELIMQMLDTADRHSPYLDVFSRSQRCVRKVKVATTKNS